MSSNDAKTTEALAGLVGLMLVHNSAAGLYDQFAKAGRGTEYNGAMKKAILVLHEQGALHGVEQKLGVKIPAEVLKEWSQEQPEQETALLALMNQNTDEPAVLIN